MQKNFLGHYKTCIFEIDYVNQKTLFSVLPGDDEIPRAR